MNSLRKILGFFTVIMLVAFTGSAMAAGNNKIFKLTLPAQVTAGSSSIVATFENISPDGNSTFKSLKLFAPAGVTITAASIGAGYTGIATVKTLTNGRTAVWVDQINLPVKPFGPVFTLNLTVTVGCGISGDWSTIDPAVPNKGDQVWTGSGFTGQNFAYSGGNLTSVLPAGTCFGVTYDGNTNTGGTAPVDSTLYATGAAVTLAGPGSLVKALNAFTGWNLAADGSGASYSAGSTYTMGTSGPTFYAQWSAKILSIANPPTSALVGTPFNVTVNSVPSGAVVTFEAGCDATATKSGNVFTITVNKLPVTGTCTMTFSAPDYAPVSLTNLPITGELSCTEYDSSLGALNSFFDPDADTALVGTPLVQNGWGLKRSATNLVEPPGCSDVNYTFSLVNNIASFIYVNTDPPQKVSVKYVILFDPVNATDGWTEYRPQVAWKTSGGLPIYIDGLACLKDDLIFGAAVMPTIPAALETADYSGQAKMCIAQMGWTSKDGQIQYWIRVIDQGDGYVKGPT